MKQIFSSVFSFLFVCILLSVMAVSGVHSYCVLQEVVLVEILGEQLFPLAGLEALALVQLGGVVAFLVLFIWGIKRCLSRKKRAERLAELEIYGRELEDENGRLVQAHDDKQVQLQQVQQQLSQAQQNTQQLQQANAALSAEVTQLRTLVRDASSPQLVDWLQGRVVWLESVLGKAAAGQPVPPPMPLQTQKSAPGNGVPVSPSNNGPQA